MSLPRNVLETLKTVETIEITTNGRSSGLPRRIEIWMYTIDGRHVITGTPGPRDWYANVLENPDLILHLPTGVDVSAEAEPVRDSVFRRRVFTADKTWWYRDQTSVDDLVENSPMVELTFPSRH